MRMESEMEKSNSIGFCGFISIIFVIAKITGYIDWNWLIVLFPLTISAIIIFAMLTVAALAVIVEAIVGKK